jgi:hypothetical protein
MNQMPPHARQAWGISPARTSGPMGGGDRGISSETGRDPHNFGATGAMLPASSGIQHGGGCCAEAPNLPDNFPGAIPTRVGAFSR